MDPGTLLSKAILRTTSDHIAVLRDMGIETVEDFLSYVPRGHEDRTRVLRILEAGLNEKVTLRGVIDRIKLVRTRRGKFLVTAKFIDPEGSTADVVWFNQPHVTRMLRDGQEVVLTGKLVEDRRKLQLQSPKFEEVRDGDLIHAGRLVPIYPQHEIINTTWMREKITLVKHAIADVRETLPLEVVLEEKLLSRADALKALHFPDDAHDVTRARKRLAFEVMFEQQRSALEMKKQWKGRRDERLKIPMDVELIRAFFKSLRFTPTDSQRIAIYEILRDMERDQPMSRLLEGDVGSGKTLVATAVIANVLRHGGQCAMMVPTEVLARQHADSIGKTLLDFHNFRVKGGGESRVPSVALLTGSAAALDAEEIMRGLASGTIDLVIGTHALIEDDVQFGDLRLVIVDEQHRFGVRQRAALGRKGNPHFLAMTATPIPRTLALTAYGHHDLSVLLEKPGNRTPVRTKVVAPKDRRTVELFVDREIEEGRQVFVICPLIRDSEVDELAEVRNVQSECARLRENFPRRRIAALHGKMTPSEKENSMRGFKGRESDILVSTSVIEVGIDVPNATIIIIEGSERFGLAQLHQFRGRVGRGDHPSHCFLFTTSPEQARSQRLKAMEKEDSGFRLAEIDLKIRGPGEIYGIRQSGIPEGVIQSLLNPELVVSARRAAEKFLGLA